MKAQNEKFILSFDEWTSTSNKRYINIIIHSQIKFWNTGLLRIKNSFTAETCVDMVKQTLQKYKLNLDEDIVAITTDGASTMVKVGNLIGPNQQLCFAHGIQLAVVDILYKKKYILSNHQDDDDNDDEDDDDDLECVEIDSISQFYEKCNSEVTDAYELNKIINKVRRIVRTFRKSPKKNDVLQKYIKVDHGKELKLILDCKTRWSSLLEMLERFILLEAPLKKAVVDIKIICDICDEAEFRVIKEVVQTLKPVELAVKALCQRDMNLCSAEAAIIFMLNELEKCTSEISFELFIAIKRRTLERRTVYTTLLNFLTKGSIQKSVFELTRSLPYVRDEIVRLLERLQATSVEDEEEDLSIIESPEKENINMASRLAQAIEKAKNPAKQTATMSLKDTIIQEISVFTSGGKRGIYLDLAFNYLMTIPPTSVECERCFSSSGLIANKIRSTLADDTLSALVFLKYYLKNT